jgi:hypothetical protein
VIGAGLSAALRLPNTRELLMRVHQLATSQAFWGQTRNLDPRLETAYKFLYPEQGGTGFRPDAVDFFSLLKAYSQIGRGLTGGLKDSGALLTDLKFAIANALVYDLREAETALQTSHAELEAILTAGNVVITLNWDMMIERYAFLHDIPLRLLGEPNDDEVLLLKLHGSIDWTLESDRTKSRDTDNYSALRERILRTRRYTAALKATDEILRTRALEHWNDCWRKIKSRTREPFIVTMSQGKASDLERIQSVWDTAYYALSAAKEVRIIGYSMPHDDVEVRALLRAGVSRGSSRPRVYVQNPAPDVHDRIRNYLSRSITSNYVPFPGYH